MANAPARQAGRCGFESRWDREGETPVRIWLTLTSVSGAQVAGDAAFDIGAGMSDSSAERTPLFSFYGAKDSTRAFEAFDPGSSPGGSTGDSGKSESE
jgi:hypothetical protein